MLDEIYSRISVSDLFPEARQNGSTMKMLCPFHNEKTPSFVIYDKGKQFHCFGCGEHGSYIDYVIKRGWAVDFKSAVQYLAQIAGVEVNFSPTKKIILEVNKTAMELFHSQLKNNPVALEYLEGRGITPTSIEKFKLGYAGRDYIQALLKNNNMSIDDLKLAGLLNSKGVEFFKNRIMFPIMKGGEVYGFAGRVLDNSQPKYINSPNTVFRKGSILYGLNPTGIKSFGYAIVVEGYTDVIALHQIGFNNAVAAMGTTLTNSQIKELKFYTKEILLLFDGDSAGLNAVSKTIEEKLLEDVTIKVGILPEGEDPLSCITKHGSDCMTEIINSALEVLLPKKIGGYLMNDIKEQYASFIKLLTQSKNIGTRPYMTVAGRVKMAMDEHIAAGKKIEIEPARFFLAPDGKTQLCQVRVISELKGTAVGTIEVGTSTNSIDRTNPYANAETSAVGRALGFLGYGLISDGIASYEEMLTVNLTQTQEFQDTAKPAVDINGISVATKVKIKHALMKAGKTEEEALREINALKTTDEANTLLQKLMVRETEEASATTVQQDTTSLTETSETATDKEKLSAREIVLLKKKLEEKGFSDDKIGAIMSQVKTREDYQKLNIDC